MSSRYVASDHALIDAIRECLGLDPLYGEPKHSKLWDAMPFDDGSYQRKARKHSEHAAMSTVHR